MLAYLRDMSERPVAKVLMGILIFSFVGWGVAEWIFGGATIDSTLVRIGGDKISVEEFNSARARAIANLSRDQQKQIYADANATSGFNAQILTQIINNTTISAYARDLGFIVSDRRIAAEIRNLPEFQTNGKFDATKFDFYLNNTGMTENDFANNLRSTIVNSMVLGALNIPVAVPEFAVHAVYNARYATRDIEYSAVNFNADVGNPTDEQLREYYAQNPKILSETRDASYILIVADMSKPDVYDAAFKKMQSVEDAIISGESMRDVASKHNAKFVNLPNIARDDASQIRTKAFAMDEGTESEIMETDDGFVIVRVERVNPARTAEFDAVKKSLVADWIKAEQKKSAYLSANEMLVKINKNNNDVKLSKTINVSRVSGAPIDVLNATFANKVGTNTIVASDGAYYVLRIVRENASKMDNAKMTTVRTEMQKTSLRNLADDFSAFLSRKYPSRVNEKVFERFFGTK